MVHLLVVALILALNGRYKTFRQAKYYHPTLIYVSTCDLIYHYICHAHRLWMYNPDAVVSSQLVTNFLYAFVFLPATALLFLSRYPEHRTILWKCLYVIKWIAIYFSFEWVYLHTNNMSYYNGWNFLWSALFYFMMFPMFIMHHKKPALAYPLTLMAIVFWVLVFRIPIE